MDFRLALLFPVAVAVVLVMAYCSPKNRAKRARRKLIAEQKRQQRELFERIKSSAECLDIDNPNDFLVNEGNIQRLLGAARKTFNPNAKREDLVGMIRGSR
jgi:hypothetical protein